MRKTLKSSVTEQTWPNAAENMISDKLNHLTQTSEEFRDENRNEEMIRVEYADVHYFVPNKSGNSSDEFDETTSWCECDHPECEACFDNWYL